MGNNIIYILLSILTLFHLLSKPVYALEPPTVSVIRSIVPSNLYFNDDTGAINAEITPWNIESSALGGWNTYMITTDRTAICSTPSNIFALTSVERIVNHNNCKQILAPTNDNLRYYNRDYNGAFTGHILNLASSGWALFTINHGESYNSQSCPPTNIGYGQLPCKPEYNWGSYNGWITLSKIPWDSTTFTNPQVTDLGPIAWPSNGYIQSLDGGTTWIKGTGGGLRHPHSIIHNNYLYVYYDDLSQGQESEGRGPGLKVIRAPITDSGINPQDFRTYYNGAFTDSALPSDFNRDTYYNSVSAKGGRASSIFPREPAVAIGPILGTGLSNSYSGEFISFSVAKIANSNFFLGTGWELGKGTTLRLSSDLVNWSDPYIIPGTQTNYWAGGVDLQFVPFAYPILANANGATNTQIDAHDFYVLGTQTAIFQGVHRKIVNTIHLKLTNFPPANSIPTPTPSSTPKPTPSSTPKPTEKTKKPGDINNDGEVNSTDYIIIVSDFGTKYSIFDYNTLVANFEK